MVFSEKMCQNKSEHPEFYTFKIPVIIRIKKEN